MSTCNFSKDWGLMLICAENVYKQSSLYRNHNSKLFKKKTYKFCVFKRISEHLLRSAYSLHTTNLQMVKKTLQFQKGSRCPVSKALFHKRLSFLSVWLVQLYLFTVMISLSSTNNNKQHIAHLHFFRSLTVSHFLFNPFFPTTYLVYTTVIL